jgi:hypothetical protein
VAKLTSQELHKLREEKQRAEWFGMLRRLFGMALFQAIFGRDRKK